MMRRRGCTDRVVLISTPPFFETSQIAVERDERIVAARAGRLAEEVLADTEWRGDVMALVRDMALGLSEGFTCGKAGPCSGGPIRKRPCAGSRCPP